MTLLFDMLILSVVAGALAFTWVLMRFAKASDAHIELLTPAMRERLRLGAAGRDFPRLHGGRTTRPPRPV